MMDDDGELFLNITAGTSINDKRIKTSKKDRVSKRRQERKAEDQLLEDLKSAKSEARRLASSQKPGFSERDPNKKSQLGKGERKPGKRKRDDDDGDGRDEREIETKRLRAAQSALFYNNPEIPRLSKVQVESVKEKVFSGDKFSEFGLHPYMVSNLEDKLELKEATAVQKVTIPGMLGGRDVLVKSQTGSGKTLAYAVPIIQQLQEIRPKIDRADGILALVIVPTRELALQSFDTFQKLVRPFTWVVPGCLMGGERKKAEKSRLRKGLNIVISTPGRLLDHIENTKNLSLGRVRWLVIDEADRLLDMGFEKEVREIINALSQHDNDKRRTALLSATLSAGVERLAGMSLQSPIKIDMTTENTRLPPEPAQSHDVEENLSDKIATPENLKQHCIIIPSKLRLVSLAAFILWKCKMAAKRSKILVFMSTQDAVDFHHRLFRTCLLDDDDEVDGVDQLLYRLHGEMPQKERTEVFNKFSAAESGVLLCTDVAARGLDLPQVRWIVQYMAPGGSTDYIHRVGRTARIGSRGNALLFLTPAEAGYTKLLSDCNINLIEVQMNHILQTLLVEKNKLRYLWSDSEPPQTIQEAASALQTRFIDTVYRDIQTRTLARKAYQSYIGSYAAYPSVVKHIFHIKNLHLGHVATSFGLQEAPKKIGTIVGTQAKKHSDSAQRKTRKFRSGALPSSMHRSNASEFSSGLEKNDKSSTSLSKKIKYTHKQRKLKK